LYLTLPTHISFASTKTWRIPPNFAIRRILASGQKWRLWTMTHSQIKASRATSFEAWLWELAMRTSRAALLGSGSLLRSVWHLT
jgi:hypothetical protein